MNSILVFFLSIVFIIAGIATFDNKGKKIKVFFSSINKSYLSMINIQEKFTKMLLILSFVFSILGMIIIAYNKIIYKTGQVFSFEVIVFTIILFVIAFFIMYLLLGIPLLIVNKIHNLIGSMKNDRISKKLLISFFIIVVYSFFLWASKDVMIKLKYIVFIGLIVSYILNIEILVNIIMNPLSFCIDTRSKKIGVNKMEIIKISLVGDLVLLALIIINLFLEVLMISYIYKGAYYSSLTGYKIETFSLFYYTIISFTTIGYGDIVPNGFGSQLMSIIISLTSVICLVIFIGSALSVKDKLPCEEKVNSKCKKS